jgi:aspartate/methionine/tyrosine aminotransferase
VVLGEAQDVEHGGPRPLCGLVGQVLAEEVGLPVQVAAAAALNGPQDCVEEIRKIYKGRRDCLVESFARAG